MIKDLEWIVKLNRYYTTNMKENIQCKLKSSIYNRHLNWIDVSVGS